MPPTRPAWRSQTTSASARSPGSSHPQAVDRQAHQYDPPPSLQPHYRAFTATTRRSAPVPRITTLPLADLPLGVLAPDDRPRAQTAPLAGRPIGATGSRVPHESPDHARATIHAGHPPGQSAGSRQAAPGAMTRRRFRMSPIRFRHVIGGSLALAFVIHT